MTSTASEPAARPGTPRYGGTLRLRGPGGVDHIDTASAYYATSAQILRALARQLFAYPAQDDLSEPGKAFAPAPDLAAEIPTVDNGGISADLRTYTIRLRDGVRWNSAPPREVTAHDVVRGFKRLPNPVSGAGALTYFTTTIQGMREYCDAYRDAFAGVEPTAAAMAGFQNAHDIAGLRALDDKTLEFRLLHPANDFLNILATGFTAPAPVEYDAYVPDSMEFRRNTLSCAPYRLVHYADRGMEIRMERNPVWRAETDPIRGQYVDRIEIEVTDLPVPEMERRMDAGEVDLAWSYTSVSWDRPKPGQDAPPRSYPGFALNPYLVFNLRSPNAGRATSDPRVRKAIAYAVDKVAVGEILDALDAPNQPLGSVIPAGSIGHRGYDPYPTPGSRGDLAKARELLVDAGYGEGLTLIAAVRKIGIHLKVMECIAARLEEIGITLDYRYYTQAEYYGSALSDPEAGRAGAWDIAEPGFTPDWFGNNGRVIVQPLFQSNDVPGTTNYGGYSSPEVDALIERALQEPAPDAAEELWHQVDVRVMEDLPVVPILSFAAMTSRYHGKRVRNPVQVPQIEFFDITNIWLDPAD
ncbi:ABC transporter substrate-binding protein [Actinomadura sp. WMMB 499]|uniref:ABC transporter substrate-binding protein n=1 Tax=Actinomadura sp. WMMB 499 TaxID=1219491 RepID=UPI0012474171|nr:ABC transporter substrate-binding protein [Actinomadura sp. WMMB 499]QFG22954.1 ABC transporter substrate-binding protein [Actinomadura sp. WMMB 499]